MGVYTVLNVQVGGILILMAGIRKTDGNTWYYLNADGAMAVDCMGSNIVVGVWRRTGSLQIV